MIPGFQLQRISGLLFLLCLSQTGQGQFSTYVSATYGYQSNPLFDYRQVSDPVQTTYLETSYTAGNWNAKYAGGLTLFNRLTERNYLDHSFRITCSFLPKAEATTAQPDSNGNLEESEADVPPPASDSLGASGAISIRATGRHDKDAYRDFDNASGAISGTVRWGFVGWNLRFGADGGYRAYPYTRELSNTSGVLSAELTIGTGEGLSAGVGTQGGLKHFVNAAFDSGQLGPAQTTVAVASPGSGKGGATIVLATPSVNQTIVNADVQTIWQLAGSFNVAYGWKTGSLKTEVVYRHNLVPAVRILARTAETSTIDEDLYNDYFNYSGLEANITLRQRLPASIQLSMSLEYIRKRFGAPAYDLLGDEVAGARVDRVTGLEVYISRYIPLSGDVGLDIAISGGAMRNESNDNFNDYSGWLLGFSLGVGF